MSPEELNSIKIGAGVVSGLLSGKVWDYFARKRESKTTQQSADQSGFEILQKAWKDEFHRLESKIDEMNTELGRREKVISDLEHEVMNLKTRMSILSATTPSLPIPAWKKSPDGVMLGLNEAYEKAFLTPQGFKMSDYVGSKDEKIWGKSIADHFKENDNKAINNHTSATIVFEEHQHNLLEGWVFLKYPEFIEDTLVSISGIGIPKKDYIKVA